MNFLEKDLERIIYETKNEILEKRGLYLFGKKIRQLKIGNYGISDLISYKIDRKKKKIYIQILELKQNRIGYDTLDQSIKYSKGITRYFIKRGCLVGFELCIQIVLIGSSYDDKSSFLYSLDMFKGVNAYIYEYKIDGLRFNKLEDFGLINEGFNI